MLTDSNPNETKAKSVLRNPLLYSSVVLGLVLLIVGSIMVSRWIENRRIEENLRQESERKKAERDRLAVESLGGKDLAIQSFYASPGVLSRGQAAQLCYDVANAQTVKLDPPAGAVWPSHSRCIEISPAKNTTYTLTIEDAAGNTKTSSVEVKVQ